MHAAWTIETDFLADFLNDPALHEYLKRGVPILAVFEDHNDYERLRSMVTDLPLSDDDEARRDRADQARLDAADEAQWEDDHEPVLDYDE